MSVVRIDWNPDRAGYRSFGRAVFIGFTLIGLFLWWRWGTAGHLPWFIGIPAVVWALAAFAPRAARPLYLAWMGIAFVMGTIVSTILLAIIYWIVFGFVALCFRIGGRDRLRLKEPAAGASTWVAHGGVPARERRQAGRSVVGRDDVHATPGVELHDAGPEREQRVVPPHAHVLAGVDLGAALANENVARDHVLAGKLFDAAAF